MAAPRPTASAMLPVPASNLLGMGWNTVFSKVTSAIMLPPPCQGGMSSSTSRLPHTTPMPVGPKTLWPENTKKSAPMSCTSTRMCEMDCAPSTSALAPARCARATISLTGTTVPSAFDTCVTATILVRSFRSFWYSSSSTWPESSTGITRSLAPLAAASCCQGTMLAWCSRWLTMISSPSPMCCAPQLLATRLMASVVPRTKITSFTSGALMNCFTRWRAPS